MPDGAGAANTGAPERSDVELLEQLKKSREALIGQIREVIVGQTDVIDQVLTALFCRGHAIMVGVPGLAKTLLVRTIASILSLEFRRIQFTPDLMPSDIIGSDVLEGPMAKSRRSS
jgi:MoxR-like ATPase